MCETILFDSSVFGPFKVYLMNCFFFFIKIPCKLGLWVFVTLLPTLMLANEDNDKPLGKQDYLGWALWATGMFFEIVADMQKTSFKNDPKNQVSKMFLKKIQPLMFQTFDRENSSLLAYGLSVVIPIILAKSCYGLVCTYLLLLSSKDGSIWVYSVHCLCICLSPD